MQLNRILNDFFLLSALKASRASFIISSFHFCLASSEFYVLIYISRFVSVSYRKWNRKINKISLFLLGACMSAHYGAQCARNRKHCMMTKAKVENLLSWATKRRSGCAIRVSICMVKRGRNYGSKLDRINQRLMFQFVPIRFTLARSHRNFNANLLKLCNKLSAIVLTVTLWQRKWAMRNDSFMLRLAHSIPSGHFAVESWTSDVLIAQRYAKA